MVRMLCAVVCLSSGVVNVDPTIPFSMIFMDDVVVVSASHLVRIWPGFAICSSSYYVLYVQALHTAQWHADEHHKQSYLCYKHMLELDTADDLWGATRWFRKGFSSCMLRWEFYLAKNGDINISCFSVWLPFCWLVVFLANLCLYTIARVCIPIYSRR